MLEKVAAIIREQLNQENVEIKEATRFKEDLEVDSLDLFELVMACLLYTSPIPRDAHESRMPSSA